MCLCRVSSLVIEPARIWPPSLPLVPLRGLAGAHLRGAPLSTCGQPVSPSTGQCSLSLGSPTQRAACLHLQAAGQSLCRSILLFLSGTLLSPVGHLTLPSVYHSNSPYLFLLFTLPFPTLALHSTLPFWGYTNPIWISVGVFWYPQNPVGCPCGMLIDMLPGFPPAGRVH